MEIKPTISQKFDVLAEDLRTCADLAMELQQNCLASILFNLLALLIYAREKKENIVPVLEATRVIADKLCLEAAKVIKPWIT